MSILPVRRETKQLRSETTRDQILVAAFECIRDLGYSRTTMELVAVRAGCTRSGVIYHFGSNKTLLTLAVASMLSNRLLEIDLTEVTMPGTRTERLVAALHKATQVYAGEEALVLLDIWIGCRTDSEMRQKLGELVREMNEKVVDRWLEVANLERLAPQEAAFRVLFRAGMRGLMIESILHGTNDDQEQAKELLIELGRQTSAASRTNI